MPPLSAPETLRVGLAQIAPVFLDRAVTLARVIARIEEAAAAGCRLVCFGESLVPGYPFWLSLTHGSRFDDPMQKRLHAHYLREAVQIERGDLDAVRACAKTHGISVYLGIVERPSDRGGHSLYCSLVYVDTEGVIRSVHRKLQPTYEERLAWAPGDGHGLVTHACGPFTVGGLNCWENWMPLARAALHARGENLHVAVWPGAVRNTVDVTRFVAVEGRSYVVSVSGVLRVGDIPEGVPYREEIVAAVRANEGGGVNRGPSGESSLSIPLGGHGAESPGFIADGGSCVAGPDGAWVLAPVRGERGVFVVDLDVGRVREERQNFDISGHYSRPDVLRLSVGGERQGVVADVK